MLQQQLKENKAQHSLVIPGYFITAHDWSLMNLLHPHLMVSEGCQDTTDGKMAPSRALSPLGTRECCGVKGE